MKSSFVPHAVKVAASRGPSPMLMRADRGMAGGSERRSVLAVSGSDIAMSQKHEAATARELGLRASS
eukprot:1087513-Pleurochrysis_carterae.AAC.1